MELLEREAALEQLDKGLRDAAAGRGRLIAVTGPGGIGKTAVVRQFVDTATSGARVLWTACDDLTTPRPLGPLIDLSPLTGDVLRAALATASDTGRLFTAVVAELSARPSPTVLVIDDLQWVDQATLDVLVYVARRLERLPLLLVLSARGSQTDTTPLHRVLAATPAGRASRLPLTPLSLEAVAALVGDRAPEIHRRTGGIPFYVRALEDPGDEPVPGTVRDVVLGRIAALPGATREVLELLAIDPSGLTTQELDVVWPGWELDAMAAEAAGFVVHDGARVVFAHELVREAVAESLPGLRRRDLHRRLLDALAPSTDATRVVHHAVAADDIERLVPASLGAARAARRVHAHEQARAHYDRLRPHRSLLEDVAEQAAVAEEHAEELLAAGRLDTALQVLSEAVDLRATLGQPEQCGRLLARRANYLAGMGRHREEAAALSDALAILTPLGAGPGLVHAHIYDAAHHVDAWRPQQALRSAERAVELSQEVSAPDLHAYALISLGAAQHLAGEHERGIATLTEAVRAAEEVGHPGLVDAAHSEIIDALLEAGNLDAAETALAEALVATEQHEHHGMGTRLVVLRSGLLRHRGRLHESLATARSAAMSSTASPLVHWQARLQEAWAATRLGDDAAAQAVREVVSAAEGLAVRYLAPALALEAEHAWLHGRALDTRRLAAAYDQARQTGLQRVTWQLGWWLQRHGDAAVKLPLPVDGWNQPFPYEAALDACESTAVPELLRVLEVVDAMDAAPLGQALRGRLRRLGVQRLPRGPQSDTRRNPAGLTRRQIEVLRHVAAGLTNAQIAELLVVSIRTVDHHVSAILAKLGVASRAEVAARADALGLLDRSSV